MPGLKPHQRRCKLSDAQRAIRDAEFEAQLIRLRDVAEKFMREYDIAHGYPPEGFSTAEEMEKWEAAKCRA